MSIMRLALTCFAHGTQPYQSSVGEALSKGLASSEVRLHNLHSHTLRPHLSNRLLPGTPDVEAFEAFEQAIRFASDVSEATSWPTVKQLITGTFTPHMYQDPRGIGEVNPTSRPKGGNIPPEPPQDDPELTLANRSLQPLRYVPNSGSWPKWLRMVVVATGSHTAGAAMPWDLPESGPC